MSSYVTPANAFARKCSPTTEPVKERLRPRSPITTTKPWSGSARVLSRSWFKDASHPGKLEVFKKAVNRACHDNTPPGTDEMKQACGELRRLVMDYLGR